PLYQMIWTDYDFVETMDINLVSGRSFSREFGSDSTACLINEAAVRALGWENPIGKTYRITGASDDEPMLSVIGVMEDFHNQSLHQPIEPLMIQVIQEPSAFMVIRIQGSNGSRGLEVIQEQWRRIYPGHPAMEYTFLEEDLEQLYQAEQRLSSVFVAGAVLSILIACLGLLGLSSFMAEQRTREIGVRKVLGATITNVILLLSRDFTKLVLLAFVVGAPTSYYVIQAWLEGFPYRIEPGPEVFFLAGLAALLIAWLTVGYQAFKAATANPADAVHAE
ncbi:MAG: FtsX-like permease family protein, partial [Gemmatimonadetes bacterium]|nr:FtsX-like permease family protein [Gemmatimonadota bacterium]